MKSVQIDQMFHCWGVQLICSYILFLALQYACLAETGVQEGNFGNYIFYICGTKALYTIDEYFLLPLYKSYRSLRTLFGAKYEMVQISRDYRDNFEICK